MHVLYTIFKALMFKNIRLPIYKAYIINIFFIEMYNVIYFI